MRNELIYDVRARRVAAQRKCLLPSFPFPTHPRTSTSSSSLYPHLPNAWCVACERPRAVEGLLIGSTPACLNPRATPGDLGGTSAAAFASSFACSDFPSSCLFSRFSSSFTTLRKDGAQNLTAAESGSQPFQTHGERGHSDYWQPLSTQQYGSYGY